jgi:hypothetical protein
VPTIDSLRPPDTKWCHKCCEWKPRGKFVPNKGYTRWCVPCYREYQKTYQKKVNPDGLTNNYRYAIKSQYGITPDQFVEMYNRQKGLCLITGLPLGGDFVVDHDKTTGKVRGLILRRINSAMGLFKHNPEWLRDAADYLEKTMKE